MPIRQELQAIVRFIPTPLDSDGDIDEDKDQANWALIIRRLFIRIISDHNEIFEAFKTRESITCVRTKSSISSHLTDLQELKLALKAIDRNDETTYQLDKRTKDTMHDEVYLRKNMALSFHAIIDAINMHIALYMNERLLNDAKKWDKIDKYNLSGERCEALNKILEKYDLSGKGCKALLMCENADFNKIPENFIFGYIFCKNNEKIELFYYNITKKGGVLRKLELKQELEGSEKQVEFFNFLNETFEKSSKKAKKIQFANIDLKTIKLFTGHTLADDRESLIMPLWKAQFEDFLRRELKELAHWWLNSWASIDPNNGSSTNPIYMRESSRYSPLHIFAGDADINMCWLLLEHGCDPDDSIKSGRNTPLHIAAIYGHYNICTLLLRAGADMSKKNHKNHTPEYYLYKLTYNDKTHTYVPRLGFMQSKADKTLRENDNPFVDFKNDYLLPAVTGSFVAKSREKRIIIEKLKKTLPKNFDLLVNISLHSEFYFNLLHASVAYNNVPFIEQCMLNSQIKKELIKNHNGAYLGKAVLENATEMCKLLLTHGAKPDYSYVCPFDGGYNQPVLHFAASKNKPLLCRLLMESGANPCLRDAYKKTPSMYYNGSDSPFVEYYHYLFNFFENYEDYSEIKKEKVLSVLRGNRPLLEWGSEGEFGLERQTLLTSAYEHNNTEFLESLNIDDLHERYIFTRNKSQIAERIQKELTQISFCSFNMRNKVKKTALSKLYEEINTRYFSHTNKAHSTNAFFSDIIYRWKENHFIQSSSNDFFSPSNIFDLSMQKFEKDITLILSQSHPNPLNMVTSNISYQN